VAEVEKLWDKAKEAAKKEYPNVKEDSEQFYKIVVAILKKMLGIEESLSIQSFADFFWTQTKKEK